MDVSSWPGVTLAEPLSGGSRNEVWLGRRGGDRVVVQTWVGGRQPTSEEDWRQVAGELQRLHATTTGHPQRPGCATVRELAAARRLPIR